MGKIQAINAQERGCGMKLELAIFILGLMLGGVFGIFIGRAESNTDKALINQRDSLRNALDRSKLDSLSLEYYYQRKLKEAEK